MDWVRPVVVHFLTQRYGTPEETAALGQRAEYRGGNVHIQVNEVQVHEQQDKTPLRNGKHVCTYGHHSLALQGEDDPFSGDVLKDGAKEAAEALLRLAWVCVVTSEEQYLTPLLEDIARSVRSHTHTHTHNAYKLLSCSCMLLSLSLVAQGFRR